MCFYHISANRKSSVFFKTCQVDPYIVGPLIFDVYSRFKRRGVIDYLGRGPFSYFFGRRLEFLAPREQQSLIIALPARSWYAGPLSGAVLWLHVVYSVVEFGMPKER